MEIYLINSLWCIVIDILYNIGLGNGLLPVRHETIAWTNAVIDNWILRNKIQRNPTHLKNVICKVATIVFMSQRVKALLWMYFFFFFLGLGRLGVGWFGEWVVATQFTSKSMPSFITFIIADIVQGWF